MELGQPEFFLIKIQNVRKLIFFYLENCKCKLDSCTVEIS